MNKNQIQQGDTIARKVGNLPSNAKLVSKNHILIAHGESGHSHVIDDPNVSLFEDEKGLRFLLNENDHDVSSIHEEHSAIAYSPGIHRLGRVREKDWFQDMVRPVTD